MPASWYQSQPSNRNFLAPSGFKMNLDIFDGVDFFSQRVNLPDISVSNAEALTRYRSIPIAASGGLSYGELDIRFIVDEDMKNYLSIHKWMTKNYLAEEMDDQKFPDYSSGQLLILNSNFNANIIVRFDDLFPVSLTELSFDVEDQDVEYLTANVSFKFTRYTFLDKDSQEI